MLCILWIKKVSQGLEGMENSAGSQGSQRAALLEEEEANGTTCNMRKSAKFCGLQFGLPF